MIGRTAVLAAAALVLGAGGSSAHIGSPEILYHGPAGPYRVLVRILPPDVVPAQRR